MPSVSKISPCLWFDGQAEDAARLYTSIFPSSGIDAITYYGKEGFEIHGRQAGTVMTVLFHLDGQSFSALNGGPQFPFTEAISLQVACASQQEIDHYWTKLTEDGGQEGPCGWLKDKFGLSWQVTPTRLDEMMLDADRTKVGRVTKAFLHMTKFDLAELERAYAGT